MKSRSISVGDKHKTAGHTNAIFVYTSIYMFGHLCALRGDTLTQLKQVHMMKG